ncbi:hypothetical protein [Brevundimonas sp. Leaf168]|uniref:hypothetical protein n=1 Tax=Brevundimonas sp. Leaf168 TaxID=1736283 RepID=UPI0006F4F077|nr:hypothetical protein [Brevundimonas sp. Leaf168]KQR52975.1 hypothetical protein ASF81_12005 [Brevundimonas sp. Leaf168]
MPAALSFLAALKKYRKFLTLLVVLVGAAAIYFWLEKAKDDRAQLLTQADRICDTAGEPFQPQGSDQDDWGRRCLGRVVVLKAYYDQTQQGSLDALIDAFEAQRGKDLTDAALAAAMSKRAADAVANMEAENAAVENDRVGLGFACALNDLGGLPGDGC